MKGELFYRLAAGTEPGRRLVVLRHGRTAWNAEGRAQGHADIELDDLGHEQAAAVAPHVAALGPVALWTSDLARARQTCSYLEKVTGLTATEDPRLREFNVGARQGMTLTEFADQFPHEYAAWMREDTGDGEVLGAESTPVVAERMTAGLHDALAALAPGETGVVVSHGASIKTGLLAMLGVPQEHAVSLQGLDNCHWVTLVEQGYGGALRLAAYNASVGPGHQAPA